MDWETPELADRTTAQFSHMLCAVCRHYRMYSFLIQIFHLFLTTKAENMLGCHVLLLLSRHGELPVSCAETLRDVLQLRSVSGFINEERGNMHVQRTDHGQTTYYTLDVRLSPAQGHCAAWKTHITQTVNWSSFPPKTKHVSVRETYSSWQSNSWNQSICDRLYF